MNKLTLGLIFCLLTLSCTDNQNLDTSTKPTVTIPKVTINNIDDVRIAVIGAGIAGASYVHFINQATNFKVNITVYEREDRIGGRVKKDMLGGGLIEQGATLIHSSNYYLLDLMETYDLKTTIPHSGEGEAETLAIWDGNDFVLNTSTNETWSGIQMLWTYGRSLFAVQEQVKKTIPKWKKVYSHLQDGVAFKSPKEMFEKIDLFDMTQQSAYDFFKEAGVKDKIVYEFVDCISRVNYHQDGNINAFTDVVSLSGAGLDGGSLYSVDGGNDLMIKSALEATNVVVRLNDEIEEINTLSSRVQSQHVVTSQSCLTDTFDIVVVACPLDLAGISLPGHNVKTDRNFQEVHAHFVAGEIDYSYFGNVSNNPQTIFTMEKDNVPFISIAKTGYAKDWNMPIYKVFSRKKLEKQFFDKTFTNIKGQAHQEWKAYTVLSPMTQWPDFEIDKGLYYINAMESAVSAMETEAVAARNVANLTLDYLSEEIMD